MDMFDPTTQIDDTNREQAKLHSNDWVYVVARRYGSNDAVPPEAIVGAWRVDGGGSIIEGKFVPNPSFMESRQCTG